MEVLLIESAAPDTAAGLAFLVHKEGDDVAVAVRDVGVGDATVGFLTTSQRRMVPVTTPIPLGHKVALRDLADGQEAIEYGVPIGLTKCAVSAGSFVHTHNLRSARWRNSV